MLDGDAAMGTLVLNGCDDTRLTISPFDGSDPHGVPQRRFLAVGGGDEPGFDIPSAGEGRHNALWRAGDRGDHVRRQEEEVRNRPDVLDQNSAEQMVLNDVTERFRRFELTIVIVKEERGFIVGDPDLENRLGIGLDPIP